MTRASRALVFRVLTTLPLLLNTAATRAIRRERRAHAEGNEPRDGFGARKGEGIDRAADRAGKGDKYWRDFFGAVTMKEIGANLAAGNVVNVVTALGALLWRVRGRILMIPWKCRYRGIAAMRRRLHPINRGRGEVFTSGSNQPDPSQAK
jgi:hypothetical protein